MEIRAYITRDDSDQQLRVTVHEDCSLYSKGVPNCALSWPLTLADDGTWHVTGSQPEQPFADADRILAEHDWKRDGRWLVGDVSTGTYARISRA